MEVRARAARGRPEGVPNLAIGLPLSCLLLVGLAEKRKPAVCWGALLNQRQRGRRPGGLALLRRQRFHTLVVLGSTHVQCRRPAGVEPASMADQRLLDELMVSRV